MGGPVCKTPGFLACQACNGAFWLTTNSQGTPPICKYRRCKCDNGLGPVGANCPLTDDGEPKEVCNSCNATPQQPFIYVADTQQCKLANVFSCKENDDCLVIALRRTRLVSAILNQICRRHGCGF